MIDENFYKVLDSVTHISNKKGYKINKILHDGEFRSLMVRIEDDLNIHTNYANPQDHVLKAELNNRTINEAFHTMLHRTGYSHIPRLLINELAKFGTKRLNYFPVKKGISKYYSPSTVLTRKILDYNKHCKNKFGAYLQAHQQNQPTNTMMERSINGIYI